MKKNTIMVTVAIMSSDVQEYHGLEEAGEPKGSP